MATLPESDVPKIELVAEESGELREWFRLISSTVDEAKVRPTPEGLSVTAVDPANVAMLETTFHADFFSTYDVSEGVLGVNIEAIYKDALDGGLTSISKTAPVRIYTTTTVPESSELAASQVDDNSPLLVVEHAEDGTLAAVLRLIDPDSLRTEPDVPDLDLDTEYEVPAEDFERIVQAVNKSVSDHTRLVGTEDQFIISAQGDVTELVGTPDSEVVRGPPRDEVRQSLYSNEYLTDFARGVPRRNRHTFNVRLDTEFPVKIDVELLTTGVGDETYADVTYMLAPRIQSDGDTTTDPDRFIDPGFSDPDLTMTADRVAFDQFLEPVAEIVNEAHLSVFDDTARLRAVNPGNNLLIESIADSGSFDTLLTSAQPGEDPDEYGLNVVAAVDALSIHRKREAATFMIDADTRMYGVEGDLFVIQAPLIDPDAIRDVREVDPGDGEVQSSMTVQHYIETLDDLDDSDGNTSVDETAFSVAEGSLYAYLDSSSPDLSVFRRADTTGTARMVLGNEVSDVDYPYRAGVEHHDTPEESPLSLTFGPDTPFVVSYKWGGDSTVRVLQAPRTGDGTDLPDDEELVQLQQAGFDVDQQVAELYGTDSLAGIPIAEYLDIARAAMPATEVSLEIEDGQMELTVSRDGDQLSPQASNYTETNETLELHTNPGGFVNDIEDAAETLERAVVAYAAVAGEVHPDNIELINDNREDAALDLPLWDDTRRMAASMIAGRIPLTAPRSLNSMYSGPNLDLSDTGLPMLPREATSGWRSEAGQAFQQRYSTAVREALNDTFDRDDVIGSITLEGVEIDDSEGDVEIADRLEVTDIEFSPVEEALEANAEAAFSAAAEEFDVTRSAWVRNVRESGAGQAVWVSPGHPRDGVAFYTATAQPAAGDAAVELSITATEGGSTETVREEVFETYGDAATDLPDVLEEFPEEHPDPRIAERLFATGEALKDGGFSSHEDAFTSFRNINEEGESLVFPPRSVKRRLYAVLASLAVRATSAYSTGLSDIRAGDYDTLAPLIAPDGDSPPAGRDLISQPLRGADAITVPERYSPPGGEAPGEMFMDGDLDTDQQDTVLEYYREMLEGEYDGLTEAVDLSEYPVDADEVTGVGNTTLETLRNVGGQFTANLALGYSHLSIAQPVRDALGEIPSQFRDSALDTIKAIRDEVVVPYYNDNVGLPADVAGDAVTVGTAGDEDDDDRPPEAPDDGPLLVGAYKKVAYEKGERVRYRRTETTMGGNGRRHNARILPPEDHSQGEGQFLAKITTVGMGPAVDAPTFDTFDAAWVNLRDRMLDGSPEDAIVRPDTIDIEAALAGVEYGREPSNDRWDIAVMVEEGSADRLRFSAYPVVGKADDLTDDIQDEARSEAIGELDASAFDAGDIVALFRVSDPIRGSLDISAVSYDPGVALLYHRATDDEGNLDVSPDDGYVEIAPSLVRQINEGDLIDAFGESLAGEFSDFGRLASWPAGRSYVIRPEGQYSPARVYPFNTETGDIKQRNGERADGVIEYTLAYHASDPDDPIIGLVQESGDSPGPPVPYPRSAFPDGYEFDPFIQSGDELEDLLGEPVILRTSWGGIVPGTVQSSQPEGAGILVRSPRLGEARPWFIPASSKSDENDIELLGIPAEGTTEDERGEVPVYDPDTDDVDFSVAEAESATDDRLLLDDRGTTDLFLPARIGEWSGSREGDQIVYTSPDEYRITVSEPAQTSTPGSVEVFLELFAPEQDDVLDDDEVIFSTGNQDAADQARERILDIIREWDEDVAEERTPDQLSPGDFLEGMDPDDRGFYQDRLPAQFAEELDIPRERAVEAVRASQFPLDLASVASVPQAFADAMADVGIENTVDYALYSQRLGRIRDIARAERRVGSTARGTLNSTAEDIINEVIEPVETASENIDATESEESAEPETGKAAIVQEAYDVAPYTEDRLTQVIGSSGQPLVFTEIDRVGDARADDLKAAGVDHMGDVATLERFRPTDTAYERILDVLPDTPRLNVKQAAARIAEEVIPDLLPKSEAKKREDADMDDSPPDTDETVFEIVSRTRPFPPGALPDLREFGLIRDVRVGEPMRQAVAYTEELPPKDLLDKYDLYHEDPPLEVWSGPDDAEVRIYRDRVEGDIGAQADEPDVWAERMRDLDTATLEVYNEFSPYSEPEAEPEADTGDREFSGLDESEPLAQQAAEVRDAFSGTMDRFFDRNRVAGLQESTAYLNRIATGKPWNATPSLVDSLVDAGREINQQAPPSEGALIDLDTVKDLRDTLREIAGEAPDEPIKIRWSGRARERLRSRWVEQRAQAGLAVSTEVLTVLDRQQTQVVAETESESRALLYAVRSLARSSPGMVGGDVGAGEGIVWMNEQMRESYQRITDELTDAMDARGWDTSDVDPREEFGFTDDTNGERAREEAEADETADEVRAAVEEAATADEGGTDDTPGEPSGFGRGGELFVGNIRIALPEPWDGWTEVTLTSPNADLPDDAGTQAIYFNDDRTVTLRIDGSAGGNKAGFLGYVHDEPIPEGTTDSQTLMYGVGGGDSDSGMHRFATNLPAETRDQRLFEENAPTVEEVREAVPDREVGPSVYLSMPAEGAFFTSTALNRLDIEDEGVRELANRLTEQVPDDTRLEDALVGDERVATQAKVENAQILGEALADYARSLQNAPDVSIMGSTAQTEAAVYAALEAIQDAGVPIEGPIPERPDRRPDVLEDDDEPTDSTDDIGFPVTGEIRYEVEGGEDEFVLDAEGLEQVDQETVENAVRMVRWATQPRLQQDGDVLVRIRFPSRDEYEVTENNIENERRPEEELEDALGITETRQRVQRPPDIDPLEVWRAPGGERISIYPSSVWITPPLGEPIPSPVAADEAQQIVRQSENYSVIDTQYGPFGAFDFPDEVNGWTLIPLGQRANPREPAYAARNLTITLRETAGGVYEAVREADLTDETDTTVVVREEEAEAAVNAALDYMAENPPEDDEAFRADEVDTGASSSTTPSSDDPDGPSAFGIPLGNVSREMEAIMPGATVETAIFQDSYAITVTPDPENADLYDADEFTLDGPVNDVENIVRAAVAEYDEGLRRGAIDIDALNDARVDSPLDVPLVEEPEPGTEPPDEDTGDTPDEDDLAEREPDTPGSGGGANALSQLPSGVQEALIETLEVITEDQRPAENRQRTASARLEEPLLDLYGNYFSDLRVDLDFGMGGNLKSVALSFQVREDIEDQIAGADMFRAADGSADQPVRLTFRAPPDLLDEMVVQIDEAMGAIDTSRPGFDRLKTALSNLADATPRSVIRQRVTPGDLFVPADDLSPLSSFAGELINRYHNELVALDVSLYVAQRVFELQTGADIRGLLRDEVPDYPAVESRGWLLEKALDQEEDGEFDAVMFARRWFQPSRRDVPDDLYNGADAAETDDPADDTPPGPEPSGPPETADTTDDDSTPDIATPTPTDTSDPREQRVSDLRQRADAALQDASSILDFAAERGLQDAGLAGEVRASEDAVASNREQLERFDADAFGDDQLDTIESVIGQLEDQTDDLRAAAKDAEDAPEPSTPAPTEAEPERETVDQPAGTDPRREPEPVDKYADATLEEIIEAEAPLRVEVFALARAAWNVPAIRLPEYPDKIMREGEGVADDVALAVKEEVDIDAYADGEVVGEAVVDTDEMVALEITNRPGGASSFESDAGLDSPATEGSVDSGTDTGGGPPADLFDRGEVDVGTIGEVDLSGAEVDIQDLDVEELNIDTPQVGTVTLGDPSDEVVDSIRSEIEDDINGS